MGRSWMKPGAIFALTLLITGAAWAGQSKDEKNLAREEKRINDTAAKPDGEKAVVKRLVAELNASEQQIRMLREHKLDFGEIAAVLSLAQTLPGGVTDANVRKVLALREGPPIMGWGQVAQQLGAKLGKTVSQVRKAANNANREIRNDHTQAGTPAPAVQQEERKEKKAPQTPGGYGNEGRSLNRGKAW